MEEETKVDETVEEGDTEAMTTFPEATEDVA